MVDKTLTQAKQIVKLNQEINALKKQVSYGFDELERQLNFRKQDKFTIDTLNNVLRLREEQVNNLENNNERLLNIVYSKDAIITNIIKMSSNDLELIHKALTLDVTIFNRKKRIKEILQFIDKALKDNNELIKSKENEIKNNNIS